MTEKMKIARIESHDPDHHAVIHFEGGTAMGVGKEFCDVQKPVVGDYFVPGEWASTTHPGYVYSWKVEKSNT